MTDVTRRGFIAVVAAIPLVAVASKIPVIKMNAHMLRWLNPPKYVAPNFDHGMVHNWHGVGELNTVLDTKNNMLYAINLTDKDIMITPEWGPDGKGMTFRGFTNE